MDELLRKIKNLPQPCWPARPSSCKDELLREIMELELIDIDLNLYMDTHPGDQQADKLYNIFGRALQILINEYETKFGPLVNFGFSRSQDPGQWVKEPWPWE